MPPATAHTAQYLQPLRSVPLPVADCSADNEEIAARSDAPLLITARTRGGAEIAARRVHRAMAGARQLPFVRVRARALPVDPQMLEQSCAGLLDAAGGGTLFIADVEAMPASVQDTLVELLAELQRARGQSGAVRLITGTTVSLLDRIAAASFSAQLFYRLNVIHLAHPR
jgi:DNA-binding NtrC family response regulator